ncbi:MAG: HlyD family efflux transporter periplasmic adaptor subunit [Planctomycetes bacterium]|nr:HlyD family efflux transporter periplasmic adaptor subunit [Planctomycetota bacterium]
MSANPVSLDSLADVMLDEIDQLIAELAKLSKTDVPPTSFYAELIQRSVAALAAQGGAVWLLADGRTPDLVAQLNLDTPLAGADSEARRAHLVAVEEVAKGGQPRLLTPVPASEASRVAPCDALRVLCPVMVEGRAAAVLEILQRSQISLAASQGNLRLLTLLAELAADFHRHHEWRQFRARAAIATKFEQFVEKIHRSLDSQATAYTLANEGRDLVGVDRLSVVIAADKGCRLAATSGLDTFDRRANAVRTLEQLAGAALAQGEPLSYAGDTTALPPQIEAPLQSYVDESHARALLIQPLTGPADAASADRRAAAIGALVVEQFSAGSIDEATARRIEVICQHGGLALRNALAHEAVPFVRALEALSRATWYCRAKGLPRLAWGLAAVAALTVVLAVVPADFELEARGSLQPRQRRDLFAPADGVVDRVDVGHGDQVAAGQALVTLRKPELDVEFSRVLGEISTARKRLEGIQAARLVGGTVEKGRDRDNQMTAEEEELKERLRSLEAEHKILREQQAELQVRAPLDGIVVTWDVERLLSARPVARGQTLLTVARTEGPWVLEVRLADRDVGPVVAAQGQQSTPLAVKFVVATDPATTYQGDVAHIAMSTATDDKDEAFVLVTADIDREQLSAECRRPGATVIAKIHCGRRALGYVWFHELIHAVQSWLLF